MKKEKKQREKIEEIFIMVYLRTDKKERFFRRSYRSFSEWKRALAIDSNMLGIEHVEFIEGAKKSLKKAGLR